MMSALEMAHHLLSHKARLSLQQFYIDLIQSLWLIGQLIQILSYPGNTNIIVEIVTSVLLRTVSTLIARPTNGHLVNILVVN